MISRRSIVLSRGPQSAGVVLAAAIVLTVVFVAGALAGDRDDDRCPGACSRTTEHALRACRQQAYADYSLALGKCENLASRAERGECKSEARAELRDALALCGEQAEAREEVCEELGEAPYDPVIDPADFSSEITNPFLTLAPGTTFVWEKKTEEGNERIELTVTHELEEILGVPCVVVHDVASLDGEVIEDTLDWFAQDKDGNVWYFGEDSKEIEDGVIVSLAGSWRAGVDGAKPGIIMQAHPEVGQTYRQEFFLGEAEDLGEVLALDAAVRVPFGDFSGCLQTKDFSPLEPDAVEHKFYAPGVGLVLELNPETGARTELVSVTKE